MQVLTLVFISPAVYVLGFLYDLAKPKARFTRSSANLILTDTLQSYPNQFWHSVIPTR